MVIDVRSKQFSLAGIDPGSVDWPRGIIVGFDPSLAATGWMMIDFAPYTRPSFIGKGRFETSEVSSGQRDTLLRSTQIFNGAYRLMQAIEDPYAPIAVGLEMPIQSHLLKHRPEAGYVASTACVSAVIAAEIDVSAIRMSAPDAIKRVVTGDHRATKQQVKATVLQILGREMRANTDETDAGGAALAAAVEMMREATA